MRYILEQSRKAVWSQRLALVFFALFALTLGLHRFANLTTPVAVNLFSVAIAGAGLALIVGFAALVGIWRSGDLGAGRAIFGILLSVVVLALPVWQLPSLVNLPRLYDITTDTVKPPAFDALAKARTAEGGDTNAAAYGRDQAVTQAAAYPDLRPETFARPAEETFGAVREVVKALGWTTVTDTPPQNGRPGTIEATDRSFLFGFTDDIVVRVADEGRGSRIDVRSSARHGQHDLGRNADRVRQMMGEVRGRIAALDTQDTVQKTVQAREERAAKAKLQKEREAAAKAEAERRTRLARAETAEEEAQARERRERRQREREDRAIPYQRANSDPENQEFRRMLRDRFREASQGERQQNNQRRRREKAKALRRFWEQLGQF